ncbi:MAG: 3-dehydroquinate synthase [Oscillibacter sp.]
MSIQTISIRTAPPYAVSIGPGLLADCGARLRALFPPCHLAVIADSNVAPLYLATVCNSMESAGFTVSSYVFPAGESSKNMTTLSAILEFLAGEHLTRGDCVAALGGGVTGDMAGFAAGCYLRGVDYVQLPTTLLAAVDSSVGGKTAIDLQAGKNLAGLFLQPKAVLCDTDCLASLPPEMLADGAAEAIKTGVLYDESLFSLLEAGDFQGKLPDIIARCVALKGGVVEQDEHELGQRKLLNLGHTAGHAVEVCSGYAIPHGHAVAMGLALIARAAQTLDWCEVPCAARITACLTACALPVSIPFSAQELAAAALTDKKRSGGAITLVVPLKIGKCVLRQVPVTDLAAIFRAGGAT